MNVNQQTKLKMNPGIGGKLDKLSISILGDLSQSSSVNISKTLPQSAFACDRIILCFLQQTQPLTRKLSKVQLIMQYNC